MDQAVQQFVGAAERGITWIVAQQRDDGSFCDLQDGIGGYYKVPYALSLTGRQREAVRLADWIAEHHFTPEGDFRAPERKAREPTHAAWPVYANAWLVQGLHRLGFWRLPEAGPYTALKDRDGFEIHLDIAAEFSIFLTEIAWRI